MGGNLINNLSDLVSLQDAVTKNYVDTQISSSLTSAISGTAGYIAKFTGTNSIGDSIIYEDGATSNIGIGTSSPSAKLSISGGDVAVESNKKIIQDLDDTADTYWLYNSTQDSIDFYVDGKLGIRVKKK